MLIEYYGYMVREACASMYNKNTTLTQYIIHDEIQYIETREYG